MNEKTTRPLVSVVIPHYGGIEVISECITSLSNCIYINIEIIVVDNNSPDNSHEFIKTKFPEIKLLQSDYNRGFAGGCNMGAKYAKGEYILILNNDTTHNPEWIDYLVQFMDSNPSVSSVQPKIKNYHKKNILIMQVPLEDIWINIAFHFLVEEFLILSKLIMDNMMIKLKYFGLLEQHF